MNFIDLVAGDEGAGAAARSPGGGSQDRNGGSKPLQYRASRLHQILSQSEAVELVMELHCGAP